MKLSTRALLAVLFSATAAQAAGPGIVTVNGGIYKASNPNGHCGASTFGYIIYGQYKDQKGQEQNFETCLEGIAVPLGGTMDAGLSDNLFTDATHVLAQAAGKEATMKVAVDDMDDVSSTLTTLLSIEIKKTGK